MTAAAAVSVLESGSHKGISCAFVLVLGILTLSILKQLLNCLIKNVSQTLVKNADAVLCYAKNVGGQLKFAINS